MNNITFLRLLTVHMYMNSNCHHLRQNVQNLICHCNPVDHSCQSHFLINIAFIQVLSFLIHCLITSRLQVKNFIEFFFITSANYHDGISLSYHHAVLPGD